MIICPSCDTAIESLVGRGGTSPGVVILCVNCRALGIFTDDGSLRALSEPELDHYLTKPEVIEAINVVAAYHRQYGAPAAGRS